MGAIEYLPYELWLIHFFRAQGYEIKKNIFHQDNESTIKLLKNGRNSASKQSGHINIWYFWIVDRLKKENIEVEYCSTERMLANFFTKPLQGSLFRKMCDVVMGEQPITTLNSDEEIMSENKISMKQLKKKIIRHETASEEANTKVVFLSMNNIKERVAERNF